MCFLIDLYIFKFNFLFKINLNKILISSSSLKKLKLPHEDMNFDEMILEAAKCITAATQGN